MESKFPLVSVCLTTYNQEKYIRQAIESVLMQKINFEMEIIIADDFSIDTTREILIEYENRKIGNFKLLLQNSNQGLAINWKNVIETAKGKYIAYLEGDDYWTDPFKLQKQFDFLEENSKFILAFHDFITVDENCKIISDKNLKNNDLKRNRSKNDMITGCLIHQNTMMFRNVIRELPKGFFKAKNHDTFLIAYLTRWGEAGYVKCDPLYYRLHSNSLWSSLSDKTKNMNGLITFLWIFTIVSPEFYFVLSRKVASKIRSIIL